MRGPTRTFAAGLLTAALAGCGGPGGPGGGEGTTPVARGPEPCPTAGELRLGRVCWNPAGSRWHLTAMAPGGEYAFDVELLAQNRLRSTDHPAASPATDEWYVEGNTLRFFLQNRFVEYRADMTNGTVMIGDASNVRGDSWEWRGDRMQVGGGCHPDEAQRDEVCINLAGTQWTVRTPSGERVIHFEAGGALLTDQGGPTEGNRWTQQGPQLSFTLDGAEYTATIESADALSGSVGGGQWSATPVPLYPPPMH